MTADALPLPLVPDFVGHLEGRLLRELAAAVEDWSQCATALTLWEDEHLLDHPTPELLARHKATIDRLLGFGTLLSSPMHLPGFPDKSLAAMVEATQNLLRDKLSLWHGNMSPAESEAILHAVFHES